MEVVTAVKDETGNPSPKGGRMITDGGSDTCPLLGTRSEAGSREAQDGRKPGKGAYNKFAVLT